MSTRSLVIVGTLSFLASTQLADSEGVVTVSATEFKTTTNGFGVLTKWFRSPEEWSGQAEKSSDWYVMRIPPAPQGYKLWYQGFQLRGDRDCVGGDQAPTEDHGTYWLFVVHPQKPGSQGVSPHGWAHCRLGVRSDEGVSWAFKMQGHSENKRLTLLDVKLDEVNVTFKFQIEGTAATSIGIMAVTYVPKDWNPKADKSKHPESDFRDRPM